MHAASNDIFEANEQAISDAFALAVSHAIEAMGDDVLGVQWFSSNADLYVERRDAA